MYLPGAGRPLAQLAGRAVEANATSTAAASAGGAAEGLNSAFKDWWEQVQSDRMKSITNS